MQTSSFQIGLTIAYIRKLRLTSVIWRKFRGIFIITCFTNWIFIWFSNIPRPEQVKRDRAIDKAKRLVKKMTLQELEKDGDKLFEKDKANKLRLASIAAKKHKLAYAK